MREGDWIVVGICHIYINLLMSALRIPSVLRDIFLQAQKKNFFFFLEV